MASKKIKTQGTPSGQGLFNEPGLLARLIEDNVRLILEQELERHLGAQPYQRTPQRQGYRNGTKPRSMKTAVGELKFQVPQTRDGCFHPSVFERYQRSDKALVAALQEMVIQGVSTRKVAAVLEEMAGFELSATTVSRACANMEEEIERFRQRRLDEYEWPYLVIDARYEKVRQGGKVISQAVLVAAAINDQGRRQIVGWAVGDSESEAVWSELFSGLKRRGLAGVELVVSDAHSGIRAAWARHFQGAAWQRCRVHLMRELLAKANWRDYHELARDLQAIYVGPSVAQCRRVAGEVAEKWRPRAPKMVAALEAGLEDTLTVQELAPEMRRRLKSTNMLERLMRTLKQRTRVVLIFPSVASLDRLIGALLLEKQEDWLAEPTRYLVLDRQGKF